MDVPDGCVFENRRFYHGIYQSDIHLCAVTGLLSGNLNVIVSFPSHLCQPRVSNYCVQELWGFFWNSILAVVTVKWLVFALLSLPKSVRKCMRITRTICFRYRHCWYDFGIPPCRLQMDHSRFFFTCTPIFASCCTTHFPRTLTIPSVGWDFITSSRAFCCNKTIYFLPSVLSQRSAYSQVNYKGTSYPYNSIVRWTGGLLVGIFVRPHIFNQVNHWIYWCTHKYTARLRLDMT